MTSFQERYNRFLAEQGQTTICIEHAPNCPPSPVNSFFGGAPYLPAGTEWPIHPQTGMARTFLGQLNFAELWKQIPDNGSNLPSSGLLQLFYRSQRELCDQVDAPYQEDVEVRWYPDLAGELSPLTSIGQKQNSEPKQARQIRFKLKKRISGSRLYNSGLFTQKEYHEWAKAHEPRHQLQGECAYIQYDPRVVIPSGESAPWWQFWKPQREIPHPDWEMLWQIDTDDELGYGWCDGGLACLLVHKQDLARGDLSNLVFDWQTY